MQVLIAVLAALQETSGNQDDRNKGEQAYARCQANRVVNKKAHGNGYKAAAQGSGDEYRILIHTGNTYRAKQSAYCCWN